MEDKITPILLVLKVPSEFESNILIGGVNDF